MSIKINTIILTSILLTCIIACKPKDPSIYDIKSPCATNNQIHTNGHEPCIKRTPIGNKLV